MLAEVSDSIYETLEVAKVLETLGEENVFRATNVIGASIDDALSAADQWLASRPVGGLG